MYKEKIRPKMPRIPSESFHQLLHPGIAICPYPSGLGTLVDFFVRCVLPDQGNEEHQKKQHEYPDCFQAQPILYAVALTKKSYHQESQKHRQEKSDRRVPIAAKPSHNSRNSSSGRFGATCIDWKHSSPKQASDGQQNQERDNCGFMAPSALLKMPGIDCQQSGSDQANFPAKQLRSDPIKKEHRQNSPN